MNTSDPMVSVQWLKDHLKAPDVRVVDASWIAPWSDNVSPQAARRLYSEGHIPGSVFFDIDEIADTDSDLPHMLPSPEKFSSRVRKMGLGDGNRIVIYDRSNFMASARVWWMFRVMGHSDVKVLDGGWDAWIREDGAVEDLPPVQSSDRHFTVRVQNHLVKSLDQVKDLVGDASALVLDARPKDRFDGTAPEPRAGLNSGHIPGSDNVPASSLIDSAGCLKSPDQLSELLSGYMNVSNLVASCGSGVSAAVILLALQRAGRDDVALYDGSWTEWALDKDTEIATA